MNTTTETTAHTISDLFPAIAKKHDLALANRIALELLEQPGVTVGDLMPHLIFALNAYTGVNSFDLGPNKDGDTIWDALANRLADREESAIAMTALEMILLAALSDNDKD